MKELAKIEPAPQEQKEARRSERSILVVVLLIMIAWCGLFILRTTFIYGDERYFVLFDDAMISMSFARNLVEGGGLVWSTSNTPVEGFTNPLWTFAMTLANLAPVPLPYRSLIVQLMGLALLLVTMWRVRTMICRHFSDAPHSPGNWLPAVVLTGFHYSLAYWSLLGMETPLQALLIVLAVHYAYDTVFGERDRSLALGIVFSLSFLVRMDMLLMVFVVALWMYLNGAVRSIPRRRLLMAAALFLAVVAGYQIFRWLYFGELLPNTYYLKMGEVPLHLRLPRGAAVLGTLLREHALPALAILGGVAVGLDRRRSRTLLPGLLIVTYIAYMVWVGGDAWELPEVDIRVDRFVAVVLPLCFISINVLFSRLTRALEGNTRRAVMTMATAALVLLLNGLFLSEKAEKNWRLMLFSDYPPMVESHALVLSRLKEFQTLVGGGAKVVTYWAGIPAFFSDYRLIDALGYTDPVVARFPIPPTITWADYRPGHNKVDPLYLLDQQPDAFFQFWDVQRLPFPHPRRRLRRLGYVPVQEFWLRRDSQYVEIPPPPSADGQGGPPSS